VLFLRIFKIIMVVRVFLESVSCWNGIRIFQRTRDFKRDETGGWKRSCATSFPVLVVRVIRQYPDESIFIAFSLPLY